jgi:hypothetical protein
MDKNIDLITKVLSLASKIAILIGGACVFVYSVSINHFPRELSVGDGVLFIFAAACFGLFYSCFAACLVAFGVCISPVLKVIVKSSLWVMNRKRKNSLEPIHPLAPFEWSAVVPAILAFILIIGFGHQDSSAYWTLPLVSIALYVFYSIYVSSTFKLRKIEIEKMSVVVLEESFAKDAKNDPDRLRKNQMFCMALILIIPLLFSGVSGHLIEAAMRFAHVRVDKPVLYIKAPYAKIIPMTYISRDQDVPSEFTKFKDVTVLFKGFGKTTVISFKDGPLSRKFEVPNDFIIVEEQKPSKD